MNNNKKLKANIIAFSTIFIIFVLIYFRPAPDYARNPILENKDDYTRIAEIYYNDYLSNHERLKKNVMRYSTADSTIYSYSDVEMSETTLNETDNIRIIELTAEETTSAYIILDTYKMLNNKDWNHVLVYDNFVSFGVVNGVESLVYSVDGTRPSYINSPETNDSKFIDVRRISKHWYHCKEWLY